MALAEGDVDLQRRMCSAGAATQAAAGRARADGGMLRGMLVGRCQPRFRPVRRVSARRMGAL